MSEDDDDLPVLTQILRTGHAQPSGQTSPRAQPVTADALDPRTVADAPWLSDPLVIGHEPPREIGDYLAPSFDRAPPVLTADAQETDGGATASPAADAFVLPQDHDAPQALGLAYDEPEYAVEPPPEAPREDPAAFAARVRDAVLENLSARIETELDARVAQAIHAEVETALAQLQASLRTHLADAMKDVVGRAVDEEIARLAAQRSSDSA